MSSPWILVYGTRPEYHKVRCLVHWASQHSQPIYIICSGQHTDLLAEVARDPLFAGQRHLGLPATADPFGYASDLAEELDRTGGIPEGPVLVQGDTATAYGGALWAAETRRPLVHIEAGVRTGVDDDPWPEEIFRVAIDTLADYGFCATEQNQKNVCWERMPKELWSEGNSEAHAVTACCFPVTGNPGLDRSLELVPPSPQRDLHLLVTLHRRESFGPKLTALAEALFRWALAHPMTPVLWPLHPNPQVRASIADLAVPPNVVLTKPLDHPDFLRTLSRARAVLTDSGGVQEEAAFYGIPALIARQHTDRPESVALGRAQLTTPATLATDLAHAMGFGMPSTPCHVFGDGHSTPTIAAKLQEWFP